MMLTLDNDKILDKMRVNPSVALFTEKYPDHHYQERDNRQ